MPKGISPDEVLYLNTSNPHKLLEFRRLGLGGLEALRKDLPEPDADPLTVIRSKASQMGPNVIVEDTSLDVDGADIGVNVKWMLDHVEQYVGKKAVFRVLIGLLRDGVVEVYRGEVGGTIVPARGNGMGFDPVFLPEGADKTLGESKPDRYNPRAEAVRNLLRGRVYRTLPPLFGWAGEWQGTDKTAGATPTRLHMFDFDNTLFHSPHPPEGWAKGWWGQLDSLTPPMVPEDPGPEWWIGPTLAAAKRAISDPHSIAVVITGRIQKFTPVVKSLLRSVGLTFDAVYLSKGGPTDAYKIRVLGDLLDQYPEVTRVDLWEDRADHLLKFVAFVESRGVEAVPHLVKQQKTAAKYQEKKEVETAEGGTTTVYKYGPRQIANRHKEKSERIEKLRHQMADLRKKARMDLTAKDPKTRLTALAVCLMDETYERVGNPDSAENGHYGVTSWNVGHLSFGERGVTVRYTGKSGVKQEKEITNSRVVSALRAAVKGKKKGDKVLCEGDECDIQAKDVNEYLKPFGITAKDIRGLHANEEMRYHLKNIRKSGPELPFARKEKDEILKEEFQKALDLAAAAVGHEPSTLRNQYLVPHMEEEYLHDGTVIDKLVKKAGPQDIPQVILQYPPSAIVKSPYLWRRATLTQTEKDDREAERLVKPSPKIKPPRTDRARRRVQDADNSYDEDRKQDKRDRMASEVLRVFTSKKKTKTIPMVNTELDRIVMVTRDTANDQKYRTPTPKEMEAFKKKNPDFEGSSDKSKEMPPEDPRSKGDFKTYAKGKEGQVFQDVLGKKMGEEMSALFNGDADERWTNTAAELERQKEDVINNLLDVATRNGLDAAAKKAKANIQKYLQEKDVPYARLAEALITLRSRDLSDDPDMLDPVEPLSNLSRTPMSEEDLISEDHLQEMSDRALGSFRSYRTMSPDARQAHLKALVKKLQSYGELEQEGSPQEQAVLAQMRGLTLASLVEAAEDGKGEMSTFQALLRAADKQGRLDAFIDLNLTGAAKGEATPQQQFREILADIPQSELVGLLPEKHPGREVLEQVNTLLSSKKERALLTPEAQAMIEEMAQDLVLSEVLFTDMDQVRRGRGMGKPRKERSPVESDPNPHTLDILRFLQDLRRRLSRPTSDAGDVTDVAEILNQRAAVRQRMREEGVSPKPIPDVPDGPAHSFEPWVDPATVNNPDPEGPKGGSEGIPPKQVSAIKDTWGKFWKDHRALSVPELKSRLEKVPGVSKVFRSDVLGALVCTFEGSDAAIAVPYLHAYSVNSKLYDSTTPKPKADDEIQSILEPAIVAANGTVVLQKGRVTTHVPGWAEPEEDKSKKAPKNQSTRSPDQEDVTRLWEENAEAPLKVLRESLQQKYGESNVQASEDAYMITLPSGDVLGIPKSRNFGNVRDAFESTDPPGIHSKVVRVIKPAVYDKSGKLMEKGLVDIAEP